MIFNNKYIQVLLLYLLCLIIQTILFKGYMYDPNSLAFVFGGDGMVIYYDMIYHTCYGNGIMLEAMNYPHGEMIFMTDAQGSITLLLNWINNNLFDICDIVPGIMHAIIMYLMPLAAVFLFLTFKRLKVEDWFAAIFAILIAYLSPQLMRLGGHFGLTYIFIIPFTIWWILRKLENFNFQYSDILFILVQLFFFLNNPYIGFMTCGMLLLAGVYLLFVYRYQRFGHFRAGARIFVAGLIPFVVAFVILKLSDPVSDRLDQQWGFFHYNAKIEGFFYPKFSLLYKWISDWSWVREVPFESWIGIGLIPSIILIFMLINAFLKNRKISYWPKGRFRPGLKALLFASICLFIYASNRTFLGFLQPFAENYLSPLLMFKASARFAWPLYYVITIFSVLWLFYFYRKFVTQHKVITFISLGLIVAIWAYEDHNYITSRYYKNFYENPYAKHKKKEILEDLENSEINIHDYQAMFALPILQAWTDKLMAPVHFNTQFYGMRLSAATGIPMISAMLSRMSISHTLDATQMAANRLIQRDLLKKLPNRKPILLILGSDHPPLKPGEAFLLKQSEQLLTKKGYSLYRLDLESLERGTQNARRQILDSIEMYPDTVDRIYFDFMDRNSEKLFGSGSRILNKGKTTLLDTIHPFDKTGLYEFTVWHKVTHHKYGLPKWTIELLGEDGKVLESHMNNMKFSRDIIDGWIRATSQLHIKNETKRIRVIVETNQEAIVDELLIRPLDADIIIKDQYQVSFNNFILR